MTTKKMMISGISFVLAAMLLASGNAINPSFAQTNTTNTVDQTNNGSESALTDSQNWDDFQICLDDEAGSIGFATEQQIRDCFAPIYIDGNNDDNSGNNDDNSGNNDDNSGNNDDDN